MPDDEQNRFGRSFGEGYSYVALGFTFGGAMVWRDGDTGAVARRRTGDRGDASRHPPSAAVGAGLSGRATAVALPGDEILAMMQAPDIGKVIFEHTSDGHVVELPFGLGEWHLPTGWYLFGVDVSPTKHVVFMVIAALLVFLTVWYGGRQVARRHREGKAPHGFGAAVEAIVLFVRNDVAIANIGHDGAKRSEEHTSELQSHS